MKDLLLKIYEYCYGHNALFRYKEKHKYVQWLFCNVMSRLCAYVFTKYMILRGPRKPCIKKKNYCENAIVSLTSFPKRINTLWMVIDSLCNQNLQPRVINLTLCVDEFPNMERDLPNSLLYYKDYGLRISWIDHSLGPHSKYLYALQHYAEHYVITVDDDIYYRKDLVQRLYWISRKFPSCVCANNAVQIVNTDFIIPTYNNFSLPSNELYPSHNYVALGYNGVIYPPHVFNNSQAYDTDVIKHTCKRADDLWLKAQEILCDVKVVYGGFYTTSIEIYGSQLISLRSTNTSKVESGNDKQWENLNKTFNLNNRLIEKVKEENERNKETSHI